MSSYASWLRTALASLAIASPLAFVSPAAAADSCPNGPIREAQGTTALPDCQAYEKVSPEYKNSSDVFRLTSSIRVSEDGGRAIFESPSGYADSKGVLATAAYMAIRGSDGWTTQGILPKLGPSMFYAFGIGGLAGFSADLTSGAVVAGDPQLTADALPGQSNLFRGDLLEQSYELVNRSVNPPGPPDPFAKPDLWDSSPDFDHLLFSSTEALTADAPNDGVEKIYQWNDGAVELVSILPGGGPIVGEPTVLVDGDDYPENAISDDGSVAVFQVAEDPFSDEWFPIYVRKNGAETVEATLSQRTPPELGAPESQYLAGTATGEAVFFRSRNKLTDDATATLGRPDLYRFDVESGDLEDLTTGDPTGASVEATVGTSENGSRVYFVAYGVLAPGAIADEPNLYLWEEGAGIAYIATLDGSAQDSDSLTWMNSFLTQRQARVTADGEYLLFNSKKQLTSVPTNGFSQVYRYEASTDGLICVSCPPTGASATAHFVNGGTGAQLRRNYLNHAISEDGTAFFDTTQSLVTADTNAERDTYQWRDGQLSLVSNGVGRYPAFFVDATPDGSNVYFVTRNHLVVTDEDTNTDLYVARADGGIAAQNVRRVTPVPCVGEGCRAPMSTPEAATLPGSAAVSVPNKKKASKKKASKKKNSKKQSRKSTKKKQGKKKQAKRSQASANGKAGR